MKTIKQIEIRAKRLPVSAMEKPEVYTTAVDTPDTVVELAQVILADIDEERFLVFLLDVRNHVIAYSEVGRGSPDACPVDPRNVFRSAIVQGASAIIVVHNHPSGALIPSSEDLALTARLIEGGKLLNLPLIDHVIVSHTGHSSIRESNESLWSNT